VQTMQTVLNKNLSNKNLSITALDKLDRKA